MHLPGCIFSYTPRVPFQSCKTFESSLVAFTCEHPVASEKAAKVRSDYEQRPVGPPSTPKNEPRIHGRYIRSLITQRHHGAIDAHGTAGARGSSNQTGRSRGNLSSYRWQKHCRGLFLNVDCCIILVIRHRHHGRTTSRCIDMQEVRAWVNAIPLLSPSG